MKNEIIALIILLVAFLFVATLGPPDPKEFASNQSASNYSNLMFNYEIIRYPTGAEIVSSNDNVSLGFVTDPWNIKFGIVPGNGSYEQRFVSIKNNKAIASRIIMKTYGNITPFVNFSSSDFLLDSGQSSAIEISLYTGSAPFGNYSGEIDVISKTPKYGFLGALT